MLEAQKAVLAAKKKVEACQQQLATAKNDLIMGQEQINQLIKKKVRLINTHSCPAEKKGMNEKNYSWADQPTHQEEGVDYEIYWNPWEHFEYILKIQEEGMSDEDQNKQQLTPCV